MSPYLIDYDLRGRWNTNYTMLSQVKYCMALNLQSLFGLHVHSCTHWLRPRNLTTTPIWAHILGRYWPAKIDDISFFVTPCMLYTVQCVVQHMSLQCFLLNLKMSMTGGYCEILRALHC